MNDLHFAVVVGINPYPGISDLTAAHSDASDFYDWVTSAKGGKVPAANAVRILGELPPGASPDAAKPTREIIYDTISSYMARVESALDGDPTVWARTRLYFFGAGHGIAPDEKDAALLAANTVPKRYTRHISCASLLEFFTRVQLFRELVLFADCCRTSAIDTVARMPADLSGDRSDRGGVRKFFACGSIFGRQAKEETDLPADQRRGYFSRALLDGLRIGPPGNKGQTITSTWLKGYITEHMRRASDSKFRKPLEPDFVDEGASEVIFGTPAQVAPEYPVRIEVRTMTVTGLEIAPEIPGASRVSTVRSAADPAIFECRLPIGLYEAIPLGVPLRAAGNEWLFKVVEGGLTRAF